MLAVKLRIGLGIQFHIRLSVALLFLLFSIEDLGLVVNCKSAQVDRVTSL